MSDDYDDYDVNAMAREMTRLQNEKDQLKAENDRLHKCLTSILDNSADYGTVNIVVVREAFAEAARLTQRPTSTTNEDA